MENTISAFKADFRDINLVCNWLRREDFDGMLAVILWEYKDKGKAGYDLTEQFFDWFENRFSSTEWSTTGKRQGGPDVELRTVLNGYEEDCSTGILNRRGKTLIAVGFARYDFGRGEAQGSDRISGNKAKILEVLNFKSDGGQPLKLFFLNDGPGLGTGELWRRYGKFEQINPARIMVATLKMLPTRLTPEWLSSN